LYEVDAAGDVQAGAVDDNSPYNHLQDADGEKLVDVHNFQSDGGDGDGEGCSVPVAEAVAYTSDHLVDDVQSAAFAGIGEQLVG
jgi:hypothetical protein